MGSGAMRRFLFLVTIVAVVTIAAAGTASGGVAGTRPVPVLAGAQAATVNPDVDAHSELLRACPCGFTRPDQITFNLPDQASFSGKELVFTGTGTPPVANAPAQNYAAVVGATGLTPAAGKAAP